MQRSSTGRLSILAAFAPPAGRGGEPFGEPAVQFGQAMSRLVCPALSLPESGDPDEGANLQPSRALPTGDFDCPAQRVLGAASSALLKQEQLAANAPQLGLLKAFSGPGDHRKSFCDGSKPFLDALGHQTRLGKESEHEGLVALDPNSTRHGQTIADLRDAVDTRPVGGDRPSANSRRPPRDQRKAMLACQG